MVWIFDGIENKCDVYRGEDCMKKFWESLRERALKIINFEKKKNDTITKEQQELHEKAKICYISKKEFKHKYPNLKNYCKVKYHCHYTRKFRDAPYSTFNLKYSVSK